MPLFRENPVRSTAAMGAVLVIGYLLTKILSSPNAFHLTQTLIAVLAISFLLFLVAMHHQREGQILSRTQEEMVLISGFGLFWIAALLAWKVFSQQGGSSELRGEANGGFAGDGWPYPCSKNDMYCIVEEYSYF